MTITWLLQGSFLFESGGYRLLVDPYISEAVERKQGLTRMAPPPLGAAELRPDAILCTHDHMDHLDPVGLPQILSLHPSVRVTGPASVARKAAALGLDPARFDIVDSGAAVTRGPFRVTAVKAFHSDPDAIGLLVEAEGLLLYLSGDTLFREELPGLVLEAAGGRAPDYALVCINGKLGNMNADDALRMATAVKAEAVVPIHYGLFAENTVDPEPFVAACRAAGLRAFTLQPGVPRELPAHLPSLLPADRKWKLVWHDEFDGTELDTSKWGFRLNFWGRRFKPYTDQGVVLDGKGNLEIHLLKNGDDYFSAQLQTGANSFDAPKGEQRNPWKQHDIWPLGDIEKPKFMHRYGYYEVRCKFQKQPGWWSAFWLQSPSIGTAYDPTYCGIECDIVECFQSGKVTSGNIFGGYGRQYQSDARVHYALEDGPDAWHRFGVDWSPTGYVFYCDGRETARTSRYVSRVEQFVLLTTECGGYRSGNMDKPSDELKTAVLPDCFTVDYVRVFDEVP